MKPNQSLGKMVTLFALGFLNRCAVYEAPSDALSDVYPRNDAGQNPPSEADAQAYRRDVAKDAEVDSAQKELLDANAADAKASPQGPCGPGRVQLGQYATWGGKVNVHQAPGEPWFVDGDCTSGEENNSVAYCQKFWPFATTQVQLLAVTSEVKPFAQAGGKAPICGNVTPSVGIDQFVCCR